jgi:hypothetical protein
MKITPRRLAPLSVAVLFAAACDHAEPNAPADLAPANIAVSLEFPASLSSVAGLEEAYLKTNRLWLQFRDASSARDERQLDFRPSRQESQVPLVLRLRAAREAMQFNVEVRLGAAGVFRGTAPVTLRAGRLTTVTATLFPILAGVRAPDSVRVLTAWGDTVRVAAAGVLATGDTIQGVAVSWRSLDPGVATSSTDGTVVSVSDGIARMVATSGAFADTALVRVQAGVATIVVTPGGTSVIPLKSSLQLRATLYDSRGNVLPTRPTTWSTSGPAAITVNSNGLATAVGIGTTQVRAAVGPVSAAVNVTGIPIAPQTDSLKATVVGTTSATLRALVIPNGAATNSSFEWGSPQVSIPPSVLLPQPVGAGLVAVPVTTTLTGLRPNTLYYALVRASNSAGSAVGDTVWFTTGTPGSGSGAPSVITEGWTTIQPGTIVLIGSVDAWNASATAWFEWGTDPTLKVSQKTPTQVVSGSGRITVTAPVPVTIGTTYYFRLVAQNTAGTGTGAILSLTPGTPQKPAVISTGPVTNVTYDAATLNGSVVPNGHPTTAWFEWGTSPTLATFNSSPVKSLGGGFLAVDLAAALTGLAPNTTYYFRLVASNTAGTTTGPIFSFTTPAPPFVGPPDIGPASATGITITGATLNGSVVPNNLPTTAWFDWSTSPTLATFTSSPAQALGSGSAPVGLSFDLVALVPNTTYYFRLNASNSAGANSGPIYSFSTLPDPNVVPPSVTTDLAFNGDLFLVLKGTANPNGAATTVWFEWGASPTLSSFSATPEQAIGAGSAPESFSAQLPLGTQGYYRAVARNNGGTVYGAILQF